VTDQRRPADRNPLPIVEEEPPVVCRKLRTKMAFGALVGARDWRFGDSTSAVYWCLSTMEPAGPDNGYAHPHGCQSGRACFRPPDGYEDSDLVALSGHDPPRRG
jgi:hypothetical protein